MRATTNQNEPKDKVQAAFEDAVSAAMKRTIEEMEQHHRGAKHFAPAPFIDDACHKWLNAPTHAELEASLKRAFYWSVAGWCAAFLFGGLFLAVVFWK